MVVNTLEDIEFNGEPVGRLQVLGDGYVRAFFVPADLVKQFSTWEEEDRPKLPPLVYCGKYRNSKDATEEILRRRGILEPTRTKRAKA